MTRTTGRASCRSRAAISVIAAIVTVVTAACGAQPFQELLVDQKTQQFDELMKRPDIDQAVTRYQEMYTKIRERLSAEFPALVWEQTLAPGSASCGSKFDAVNAGLRQDDAEIRGLGNWMAQGNVPDDQWPQAASIVDSVTRDYGFNSGPIVVVDRPSNHEVDFYDPYDAQLVFGTAVNTTLNANTGCHLTAEAKQRGHPAPRPTY